MEIKNLSRERVEWYRRKAEERGESYLIEYHEKSDTYSIIFIKVKQEKQEEQDKEER